MDDEHLTDTQFISKLADHLDFIARLAEAPRIFGSGKQLKKWQVIRDEAIAGAAAARLRAKAGGE